MPESEAERRAVREQLDRVLSSPLFKNSKRYPNLLRFVVERSLNGHTETLKERTLGMEVFGRDPDYDTNADPVVRTTAVEIRKRIAQYYHEPGHEAEIRIDFPPGTYLPEFRLPQKPPVVVAPEPEKQVERPKFALAGIVITAAVVLAAAIWLSRSPSNSAVNEFWSPLLTSRDPVLIFVGGGSEETPLGPNGTLTDLHNFEKVGYSEAIALADISSFLATRKKSYRIRFQAFGKLDELKDGPSVLIGAFNNSWTLRLTDRLRFSFAHDRETHLSWIQDRQNPQSRKWSHIMKQPYTDVKYDYAIVSRVVDPTTGQYVVTSSGLAKFGTAAAGEFMTNPTAMEAIVKQAPKDWAKKNFQVVIETSVVGLSAGPAHVVASYFW